MTYQEKLNQLTSRGWICTDGSAETLQFGRKINATTWEYRQWGDGPVEYHEASGLPFYSEKEKVLMWDSGEWTEDEIDLQNYSKSEIESELSTFGYKLKDYFGPDRIYIYSESDSIFTYPLEDSIQLACECIFENNSY
jgi:hypothetical protein